MLKGDFRVAFFIFETDLADRIIRSVTARDRQSIAEHEIGRAYHAEPGPQVVELQRLLEIKN